MRTTLLRHGKLAFSTAKAQVPSSGIRYLPSTLGLQRRTDATLSAAPQTTHLQHAISNPTLAGIEKRWEAMPPSEQAELWVALRKRMKIENWGEMTLQEKKAAYWIAFGPHGPRAQDPPGEGWKVMGYSALGVFVSFIIFCAIRAFAKPPPKTMTKEWEEMTNEYLKSQNSEPITGLSSQGYTGKGQVQSRPAKKE